MSLSSGFEEGKWHRIIQHIQLNTKGKKNGAMEIWLDVIKLIKKILKKNKINSFNIVSIGITNQRETTVLWNKKTGKPVNKAIVWQDRRTSDYCNRLKNTIWFLNRKQEEGYSIGGRGP